MVEPTAIIVAAIAALPPTLLALHGFKKTEAVHAEVRTNHGKQAREYLEEAATKDQMKAVDKKLEKLTLALLEHTVQDSENFGHIASRLEAMAS